MAIAGIDPKCYILALFVRDDGVRFLLGDDPYEFKDKQLHFQPNTVANDVVEVQGNDGYLLAGQVRRPGTQSFDGYVCNGTNSKAEVEVKRREFLQFFRRSHFYKVIYVFPNGTAIQRKQGFLVDDPTVQELYQQYPEYHVALNFEDVNYYTYEEDDQGHEIYAKEAIVPLAGGGATGGLIWDNYGVVWEGQWSDLVSVSGSEMQIENEAVARAPIQDLGLQGDTYQQTYSGKNLFNSYALAGKTFHPASNRMNIGSDGMITLTGNTSSNGYCRVLNTPLRNFCPTLEVGETYYLYLVGENLAKNIIYLNSSDFGWGAGTSRTITQSDLDSDIVFYGGYNTTTTIKIMVTKAQDNNYEPYVGGIPAPNPDYPQAVQTVTGEQTVEVTGKNLFDKNNVNQYMGYFEGDTDNPSLVYGSTARNRVIYIKCKPSTTYSISLTTNDGINSPQVGTTDALPSDGLAVTKLGNFASGSLKLENLTTSATAQYIVIRFQTNPSTVRFDNISQALLAGLQIEQGSTATAYEPYQRQSYEINLGKNLWGGFSADMTRSTANIDFNNLANGDIFVAAGTSSGQANSLSSSMVAGTDRLITLEAGTYTISGATGVMRVQLVNSVGTALATDTGSGATVTLTSTTQAFVRVSCDGGQTVTDTTIHPQLEKGSTATPYAPYFTPIELCKIGDYQDYIYKSGDDWYLHKEVRHLSLPVSGMNNGESFPGWRNQTQLKSDLGTTSGGQIYTDTRMVTNIAGLVTSTSRSVTKNFNGSNATLLLPTDYYGSDHNQTYWKTNYSNLVVDFYYGINGTITDTQITDTTLIGQLEALGAMKLFIGENNLLVSATGMNLPATLEFSYPTKFAKIGAEWEEGGTKGATIVDVNAIDNTYPVWELMGPAVNPTISVLTTNTTLTYNGTITASQKLVIDMFNKTATLNGTSVIGNVSGDFVYMAPGTNRIAYTAENTDAPDSTIYWQEVVG